MFEMCTLANLFGSSHQPNLTNTFADSQLRNALTFLRTLAKDDREDPLADDAFVVRPRNQLLSDVAAFLVANAVKAIQVVL